MSTVPKLPPLIARVVPRLARALAAERIMLFGSYAKGAARGGSDVDILVVIDIEEITAALQRRARQLTADCFPPVDVVLCTQTEIEGAAIAPSPFLESILGSAVCLFERLAPEMSQPSAASRLAAADPGSEKRTPFDRVQI